MNPSKNNITVSKNIHYKEVIMMLLSPIFASVKWKNLIQLGSETRENKLTISTYIEVCNFDAAGVIELHRKLYNHHII